MADAAKANDDMQGPAISVGELAEQLREELSTRTKAQRFFAQLALEARKPSFGEQAAGWTRSLLIRAEEAGLFDPKLENA
jgi:hypothetical protein